MGRGGVYGDWRPTVVFPSIEEESVVALHNACQKLMLFVVFLIYFSTWKPAETEGTLKHKTTTTEKTTKPNFVFKDTRKA